MCPEMSDLRLKVLLGEADPETLELE